MLRSLLNAGTSGLQNAALLSVNVGVAALVIGLTALTLIEHFEDTPEIKTLACIVGIERTDCPDYKARLRAAEEREQQLTADLTSMDIDRQRLEAEKASIDAEKQQVEAQLDSLRSLLEKFDSLMGFEHIDSPNGRHRLTIGTQYITFVDFNDAVNAWQCSFDLPDGPAGEVRKLYFRKLSGEIAVTERQLRKANIDRQTFEWAQERCRPLSIDGGT